MYHLAHSLKLFCFVFTKNWIVWLSCDIIYCRVKLPKISYPPILFALNLYQNCITICWTKRKCKINIKVNEVFNFKSPNLPFHLHPCVTSSSELRLWPPPGSAALSHTPLGSSATDKIVLKGDCAWKLYTRRIGLKRDKFATFLRICSFVSHSSWKLCNI